MTAPDDTSPAEGAPITTGSGVERSMACLASNVLERAWVADTEHSARGVAVHAYLERISNGMTAEESLALVDEEYREVCEGLDLSGLALDQLSAEVTFVINLVTGEARVLGQGLERDYSGVGADELPLTIDLAGVDPSPIAAASPTTSTATRGGLDAPTTGSRGRPPTRSRRPSTSTRWTVP